MLRTLLIAFSTAALWSGIASFDAVAQTPPPITRLPSWNDGPSRRAILDFVTRVTAEGAPDFVPVPERIAVFDNDGTLWCEQPMYVQVQFIFARVHALAPQHPEWQAQQPFAAVLQGDKAAIAAMGEKGLLELLTATHSGLTSDEFHTIVADWIATAKHPTTGRLYTQMVYQPMLEVLADLRAHGFKTYIVSGGGIEFMRPWTERVYGIPPEQVIGSYGKLAFESPNGIPVLRKLPEVVLIDDHAGKPVGIQTFIGRRPVMAFGNSDGDLEMLQWTTSGSGPRFGALIHHTDATREWAYDRKSQVGQLNRALDAAQPNGWTIVDMQADWNRIFPE